MTPQVWGWQWHSVDQVFYMLIFADQLFVFFPEDAKVGIKTIKQWVQMLFSHTHTLSPTHPGTARECRKKTSHELSLLYNKEWLHLPKWSVIIIITVIMFS